jgi:hypothetical protein
MDVDLATQMPEDLLMLTDKMSMAVSLECRVPLLDQKLVKLASGMPASLRMRDVLPRYSEPSTTRSSFVPTSSSSFRGFCGIWTSRSLIRRSSRRTWSRSSRAATSR